MPGSGGAAICPGYLLLGRAPLVRHGLPLRRCGLPPAPRASLPDALLDEPLARSWELQGMCFFVIADNEKEPFALPNQDHASGPEATVPLTYKVVQKEANSKLCGLV